MIVDHIKNADYYKDTMPAIATALEKVAQYTPDTCTSGRVDIDGDNLFLKLSTFETHSSEGANCLCKAYGRAYKYYTSIRRRKGPPFGKTGWRCRASTFDGGNVCSFIST